MASTKDFKSASFFIALGMPKQTFLRRVKVREIRFTLLDSGRKLYSVKDWNKKCPDWEAAIDN